MSHLLKATENGPASEPWSALTSYLTNVTGKFLRHRLSSRGAGLVLAATGMTVLTSVTWKDDKAMPHSTTVHTSKRPNKTIYPLFKHMLWNDRSEDYYVNHPTVCMLLSTREALF